MLNENGFCAENGDREDEGESGERKWKKKTIRVFAISL